MMPPFTETAHIAHTSWPDPTRPRVVNRVVRVLLAEDDADLRTLFSHGLRRRGYEVAAFENGHAILDELALASRGEARAPDVVVMDIRMPGATGLDVLAALRHRKWRLPVILMTGFGDTSTHVLAYELGAIELLDKPLSTARLAMSIDGALAAT